MILRFVRGTPEDVVQGVRARLEREGHRTVRSPERERPILAVIGKIKQAIFAELERDPAIEERVKSDIPDLVLVNRAFQTEGEALGKITRAKLPSCQLSTYFVGRTAFHRLRQTVQREQGDKFSLGRYHEAVLSHGTLPVKYLPELVRRTK